MALVKKGDKVSINFTGTLEDGTIFDTTLGHDDCSPGECDSDDCTDEGCGCESGPMEITLGAEEFFPQIEEALIGMAPGDRKTVVIPAEEAFGEYDEEQVFTIGRDQIPSDITPDIGQELEFTGEEGEPFMVTVVGVTDDSVTLDANHPLAGENISYDIELVAIL
jgi:peptidylprolyl isomerase